MLGPGLFITMLILGFVPYFASWALVSWIAGRPPRLIFAASHYTLFSLSLWAAVALILGNF